MLRHVPSPFPFCRSPIYTPSHPHHNPHRHHKTPFPPLSTPHLYAFPIRRLQENEFSENSKTFFIKKFSKKIFFVHFSLHTFPLTSLFSFLFLSLFSPLLSPYPHSHHSHLSLLHTLIFSPTLLAYYIIVRTHVCTCINSAYLSVISL